MAKKQAPAAANDGAKPKYKAIHNVLIPGMGEFTRDEVNNNPEILDYLVSIDSGSVVKVEPDNN